MAQRMADCRGWLSLMNVVKSEQSSPPSTPLRRELAGIAAFALPSFVSEPMGEPGFPQDPRSRRCETPCASMHSGARAATPPAPHRFP